MEGGLLGVLGCARGAHTFHNDIIFYDVLSTLVGCNVALLLLELVIAACCDDLLASSQILDVATALT